jgi:hypothetical protein
MVSAHCVLLLDTSVTCFQLSSPRMVEPFYIAILAEFVMDGVVLFSGCTENFNLLIIDVVIA